MHLYKNSEAIINRKHWFINPSSLFGVRNQAWYWGSGNVIGLGISFSSLKGKVKYLLFLGWKGNVCGKLRAYSLAGCSISAFRLMFNEMALKLIDYKVIRIADLTILQQTSFLNEWFSWSDVGLDI